jgi:adenine-specific DNA-methyltransferase
MIKYLGSKRLLAPLIVQIARRVARGGRVLDLFSGTARVGHALKAAGYQVFANDHNRYAATLARCYVQADAECLARRAQRLIAELNRLPGRAGYVTETFCHRSRFFHPSNGPRIDAIREAIAARSLEPELEAVLLVSLMEAADRVDSTTGVQMAYLKQWARRALNALELRLPALLPRAAAGKGQAHELDALAAAGLAEADVAYLDPPYNQHKYLGNYHIWETLVRWDKPEVYGRACKRVDCRQRASSFNSRTEALPTLRRLIQAIRAPVLIISFNDEGYIGRRQMEEMLRSRGPVQTIRLPYKRYVGAQIGIYNPSGRKVGRVSHLRNHEFLYVVGPGVPDLSDLSPLGRKSAPTGARSPLHSRGARLLAPASRR